MDLFLMYTIKGFVKQQSVGTAVVKTLMRTYERQKNGEKVRVGMLNPGLIFHHSDCGSLGEGDHASAKDPGHQDSRSSQGPHCQTHPLG